MFLVVIVFILAVDQASKWLVLRALPQSSSLPVINGVFHLTLVKNKGAAFGLFKGSSNFIIIAASIALILFSISYLSCAKKEKVFSLSLAMIVAGALANMADRLRYGYVVDFLDFRIWPVFNIADCAITAGTALLLLRLIISEKRKAKSVKLK